MTRLDRVKAIVNGESERIVSDSPDQRPLLFYPGLRQTPHYDVAEFPWIDNLSRGFGRIAAELSSCLAGRRGFEPIFPRYSSGGRWAGLWFNLYGHRYEQNCLDFPQTIKIVEQIPRLAGWTALSALEPGAHIRPHCGVTNAKLRLHFALRTEPGCRMRVSDRIYEWTPGQILIFDDSFEHEVWVSGTSARIVLIVDFYHPDLDDVEVAYLRTLETEPSNILKGESLKSMYQKRDPQSQESGNADWVYS